ncbi:NmrA/HSCARG family protein [Streptomyces sp. ME19-01-6]|uniref:NmrA/HSCARG family protein n=1 Tax=Streptomyces sp. ME19-01-6 TaxID=3028686 RepID=UPI0029B913DA|nr:NmrA/HSCARG family protein [Streptomyces sp. ME19-01-6]MDX3227866.1 NmrA/HSCARG family protein [Streptomyces sp. ME19-01-6]
MTQINPALPVAVSGATGAQGGAAARALLHLGRPVRALTRDPATPAAAELRALGADVVRADFDNEASLTAALTDTAALFAMSTPFGSDLTAEVRQGTALLDAAATVGVRHIVFTSAANADRSTGIPHFESKWRIERHLATLDVPWTVIGPGVFMENYANDWTVQSLREGVFALPMPPGRPLPVIAARDIGAFAALALSRPAEFARRRIDIASQWRTPEQIAEAIGAASGRDIRYREVPLAVAESYSGDLAAMFRYFQETGLDVDIDGLRRDYPEVGWHTMEKWAGDRAWEI